MKIFNLVVFALVNTFIAFAKPAYDSTYYEKNLAFTITPSHTAMIVGLNPNYTSYNTINIPNYFTVQSEKYYVEGIKDGAFANSDVEKVIISSAIKLNFRIGYEAFDNCKKLTDVNIGAKKISCDINAFSKSGVNVNFSGESGVPALVEDLSIRYLQNWGMPIGMAYQYNRKAMKQDLYTLAKKFRENVVSSANLKNAGNAAVTLATNKASLLGYVRAYRNLAILMGVPENEILVAGDTNGYYWVVVKIENEWYNVDPFNYNFKKTVSYSDFFQYRVQFFEYLIDKQSKHMSSNDWEVYHERYGYNNEMKNKINYGNLLRYLNNNGLGEMATSSL